MMKSGIVSLIAGLAIFSAYPLIGQEELGAFAQEVDGQVEVSIAGGEWTPLREGDAVPIDARISTGFGASARLAVGENAVVTVEPLTRIEIENLVFEEGVERSELNLQVGRIQGEVEGAGERPTEFEVRSSIATASVRGTSFEFDGQNLTVTEGQVAVANAFGRRRTVRGGEQSSTDGHTPPESPAENRSRRATTTPYTSGGDDREEAPPATGEVAVEPDPILIINWEFE